MSKYISELEGNLLNASYLFCNPENVLALVHRSNMYLNQDNITALSIRGIALADFIKAQWIGPDDAPSLENRGRSYQLLDNYYDALILTEYNAFALVNRGEVYRRLARDIVHKHLKNYDQALADLNMVLNFDQESSFSSWILKINQPNNNNICSLFEKLNTGIVLRNDKLNKMLSETLDKANSKTHGSCSSRFYTWKALNEIEELDQNYVYASAMRARRVM
ncbi:4504_t:CDS:2 [Funneliformis mosseae]|uniref:4504_t:CDS:1 n=1 Tax=Funneliformis mosseae TaxID=27381 RepID=A0A9N9CCH4_FUNMO|nr:4504_t:CDS:2 [Funneliformis mosseae]